MAHRVVCPFSVVSKSVCLPARVGQAGIKIDLRLQRTLTLQLRQSPPSVSSSRGRGVSGWMQSADVMRCSSQRGPPAESVGAKKNAGEEEEAWKLQGWMMRRAKRRLREVTMRPCNSAQGETLGPHFQDGARGRGNGFSRVFQIKRSLGGCFAARPCCRRGRRIQADALLTGDQATKVTGTPLPSAPGGVNAEGHESHM